MRYKHLVSELSNMIIYHGDDYGTTQLEPRYMLHDLSNNQEGVGIYFTPDIDVAKTYGKYISTISLKNLKIANSRTPVSEVRSDRIVLMFLNYLNQTDENFWYLLTDYGIEVASQKEVTINHLRKLHHMMREEEIRNWQIELAQASASIDNFVAGWNRYMMIDALYEQVSKFYAVINTKIPVKLITTERNNSQITEIAVMSSWIADLDYDRGAVILTLNNGRRYRVNGVSPGVFRLWTKAPSKGRFWHSNIRGNYRASPI